MIRKCIRARLLDEFPALESLLDHIHGYIGLVFTKGDLAEIKAEIERQTVPKPARVGAVAPNDVWIYAGPSGLTPEKTPIFQAVRTVTKIRMGLIEVVNDALVVKAGERVGASEAALLKVLRMSPFLCGITPLVVYGCGIIFEAHHMDHCTNEDLRARFLLGVRNVAAVSMAINYPTQGVCVCVFVCACVFFYKDVLFLKTSK